MERGIGNRNTKKQIIDYVNYSYEKSLPIFLIVVGVDGLGKSSFLCEYSRELLGAYFQTDFLHIKDCSDLLGKEHSIQVETPSTLKTIPLDKDSFYDNKGVREINVWLQQSGVSSKKILLIENMQRMTNSAMNAFLKTCEEPLANRCIFATIDHETSILPTILSRAMVIKFQTLSDSEMVEYIDSLPGLPAEVDKKFLLKFSLGTPGSLKKLVEIYSRDPEVYANLSELFSLLKQEGFMFKKVSLLKKISEYGLLNSFLSMLIKDFSEKGDTVNADCLIQFKKYVSSNVTLENAFRYLVLSLQY